MIRKDKKFSKSKTAKPSVAPSKGLNEIRALFWFAPLLAKILLYCEIVRRAASTKVKDARTRINEAALQVVVHKLYVGKDAALPSVVKDKVAVGCALLTTDKKLARMIFAVRTVVAARTMTAIQRLPIWKEIVALVETPGMNYRVVNDPGAGQYRLKLDPFYDVWVKIITERYAQLPKPAGPQVLPVEKQIHVLATILSAYCSYQVAMMYYLGTSDKAGLLLTVQIRDRDGSNIDYILADLMNANCCRKILACACRHGVDMAGHKIRAGELTTDLMLMIHQGVTAEVAQQLPGLTEKHAVNTIVKWLTDGLKDRVHEDAHEARLQRAIVRHAKEIQETIHNIDVDAEGESSSSATTGKTPKATGIPIKEQPAADSWNWYVELHKSLEIENGIGQIQQTQTLAEQRAERDATLTAEDVAVKLEIATETLHDKIRKGEFPPEPKRGFNNDYVARCRTAMRQTLNQSEAARLLAGYTKVNEAACRKWLQRHKADCPPDTDGKYLPATLRLAARLIGKKPRQKNPDPKPPGTEASEV